MLGEPAMLGEAGSCIDLLRAPSSISSLKAELLGALRQESCHVRRQLSGIQRDLHRILLRLPQEDDFRRLSGTSIADSEAAASAVDESVQGRREDEQDRPTFGCGAPTARSKDQNLGGQADLHLGLTDLVRKLREESEEPVEPPSATDLTKRGALLPPLLDRGAPAFAASSSATASRPCQVQRCSSDPTRSHSGCRRHSLPQQPDDEPVRAGSRRRINSMPELPCGRESSGFDPDSESILVRTRAQSASMSRDFATYFEASECSDTMSVMSRDGLALPAPLPGALARCVGTQSTSTAAGQNPTSMTLPDSLKSALKLSKDSAVTDAATESCELKRTELLLPGGRCWSPSRMSTISGLGSQDPQIERMTSHTSSSSDIMVTVSSRGGKKDTKTSPELILNSGSTRRTLSPSRAPAASKEMAGGRYGRRLDSRHFSSEPAQGSPSSANFSSEGRSSHGGREKQESGWASVVVDPGVRVLGCRVRSSTPTMTSLESAGSSSSKLKSCEALRQQHEQELMKEVEEGQGMSFFNIPEESPLDNASVRISSELTSSRGGQGTICAEIVPRACGMLPWTAHCPRASWLYQQLVTVVAVAVLVATSLRLRDEISEGGSTMALTILDVLFALGCVVGLIACGVLRSSEALTSAEKAINAYAHSNHLSLPWGKQSSVDTGVTFLIWVGVAVSRALFTYSETRSSFVLEVAMFNFSALLNMGMVCYVLHICRGLIVIVDTFCHRTVDHPDFAVAVREWNRLQAVCRGACAAVQHCFVVLLMLAGLASLIVLMKVSYEQTLEVRLIPGLLLALAIFRISVWAAAVTDKCMHVPLLVNSLTAGGDLNNDRMYAVQYIVQSQAGFYLYEMRLTCSTLMKAFYVGCAVTIGIATQLHARI